MSHSTPNKEDRPGKLLSSPENEQTQEMGGSATLLPPPFSVTATGTPENSSPAQENNRTATKSPPKALDVPAAQTGQVFTPPPFRVTATSSMEEEGPEEEIESKSEQESQQFDDGTADDDAGAPSTPNDGNIPPPDQFNQAADLAGGKKESIAARIASAPGESIPKKARTKMEKAFNADFSNVKIHKNSAEAEEIGAHAFAHGNHIHFAPGQFHPESKAWHALLGHELAHVMQQREGRAAASIQASGAPAAMPGALQINDDAGLEQEANRLGAQAANTTDNDTDDEGGDTGIIPKLMLLGSRVNIDLSLVEESATLAIDVNLIEGCTATRIEVLIEEGAFVSGTLYFKCERLADVDLELTISADGTINAAISLQQDIMGWPATANAQMTEDGITGNISVTIPEGTTIIGDLKVTSGSLHLNFGEEGTSFKGNIGVSLDNGFATGSAEVALDPKTNAWSGSAMLQSTQSINIALAPGTDIILPEGFQFNAQFGGEDGFTMEGGALVTAQVVLASSDGIEAGGTAEMEVRVTEEGLDFELHKVRLVATGGLNAPDIDDAMAAQHLTSDMDAGAIITLSFEENSLSRVDLEVTGGISNAERRIGRVSFAGQATFNPFHFIGMLHAVTNAKFTLTEGSEYTTSLMPGSQLFLSMDESGVSNVDASLGLELADTEAPLAQLTVASSLPRGEGLSLSARLELLRSLVLSNPEEHGYGVTVLPSAGLTATMVEGALREIQGSLPVEVADQEGDLLSGALEGQVAFVEGEGTKMENGQASATLLRELTWELGGGEVRVLEGASVNVRFESGQVVGLGGQVEAVYDNGNHEVSISAAVDYDPANGILRSLDASMSTDEVFSLFGGNLQVSEIEGGISIRNGEVISLGGHARLDATVGDFTLAGEADITWSNVGGETAFVGAGWLEFSWFEEDNEHRYLNGRVEASIDGENFDLLGTIQVGLMEGLSGEATVAMDQEMDPVISASLTYAAQLMEASELWSMEFGLGIQIPIIPALVTIEAGILFGMSINTRPLMVFGTVGVNDWRPSEKSFPDFYASLRASWGLDIEAKAMAYLELILGIDSVLHLTGGIRAGVGLNIPIELAPYISLHGGEDGVGGEMGIDLSITPILKLIVEAYMEWGVLGIWDGSKVWELVDQELAELGNIEWGGSFAFGDSQEPSPEAPQVESQEVSPEGSPIAAPEGLNEDSSLGFGNQEQEPESSAGMTGLTDGLSAPTPESAEGDVDQEGLGGQFGQIGAYGDGIAAVGDLISIMADGFKSLIKGGPVGLIIWMIFEKPSKDEMEEKRDRVSDFRDALTGDDLIEPGSTIDLMLGILGGDYSFWIIFDKSKPFRDMVDRGLHEDATLEDRSKILEGMIKGWTGEKDESRIIEVLDYTLANESAAGVRELTEYVGGEGRVRDQYEWTDWNDKDDLDRIFGIAYGNTSTPIEDQPTYTAKEGATVKRTGRSWDELAVEAYGHASYAIYLMNFPYNQGQISQEDAYQDHQNNQNNNNNNNNGPNPWDDDWDETTFLNGGYNNNTSGPAFPSYQAYIPTMAEIVDLHESSVWQQRFQVPGELVHAHWFENYEMIAEFAYGDANLKEQLKGFNLSVPEIKEGVSVILPSPEELGPPWIEVERAAIGSSGMEIWVGPDGDQNPEMWVGSPDRLVTEVAQEALENEETESAAQQLMDAATFANDTTQVEAENAVSVASGLIDFILSSNGGAGLAGPSWEDASPGDTVNMRPDQLAHAAEAIYGHAERAAWIAVFNENTGNTGHTAAKTTSSDNKSSSRTAMTEMALPGNGSSNGPRNYKLPTWTEMTALDPLPAAKRGVAPKSTIEIMSGDTWSAIAQKAYGDWEKAVLLADWEANAGVTMEAGAILSLPRASDLRVEMVAAQAEVPRAVTGDETTNTNANTTTTTTSDGPPADDRTFTPGTTIKAKAGDTWSALAVATYDDFSLFVRLSNHPKNVTAKTLPEGINIYLPTESELMEVPEFGLGLSPTGNPLLTEMVRVPTSEELHHVWVENRADEGQEVDGVWMMASTPFELEPASEGWVTKTEGDAEVAPHAEEVNRVAKEGEASAGEIEDLPDRLRRIVEGEYLEDEGVTASDVVYMVQTPDDHSEEGITLTDQTSNAQVFLENGTMLQIVDEGHGDQVLVKVEEDGPTGFISLADRANHLIVFQINLDEVTVGAIGSAVDLLDGVFELKSAEAELLVEQSGIGGVAVPVVVGDFASGEMQILRNENGFQSVNDEPVFLPVNTGFLSDLFGGNLEVGLQARIQNDGVIGEAVCKIGGEVITTSSIGQIISQLGIPGIELGTETAFENTTFVNGFSEGDFRLQMLNIPIVTGNQFSGSLDIGLVNGEPTVTGRALVQITPAIMGVVELNYAGGGFSGEGTIQFIQGPISGELTVAIDGENVQVSGTGSISTDQFNGSATILYGRESFVDSIIGPQLSAMDQGGEADPQGEVFDLEEGNGEYVLAGFVEGTVPITDTFAATGKGIVDTTGGLTLGVTIANSDAIKLTDPVEDEYELRVPVPVFKWGIPDLGEIFVNLNFFFGIGYDIGALMLNEASASGVYSNSEHPLAPANSLNLSGSVGLDTNLTIGGGLGIGAGASLLGNTASAEVGGRLNAMLSASAELGAKMGITAGPEGIDPNFRVSGEVSGDLLLNLQGYVTANFDAWGSWFDAQATHYFANLLFPVGSMNFGVFYDPTEDQPLGFEVPEGGMFQINSWDEMLEGMWSEDNNVNEDDVGDVSMPTGGEQGNEPLTEATEDAIKGVQAGYRNEQGEIHTLKFEEHGDDLEIWRHSVPMRLEDYCDHLISHHQGGGNQGKVTELQGIKAYLEGDDWADVLENSMSTGQLRSAAFAEIRRIADQLVTLDDTMGPIPSSPIGPMVEGGGRPEKSSIDQLHQSQGNQGEPAAAFPYNSGATYQSDSMSTAWRWLLANGKNGPWIKFHIINEHLGGKANKENLIATTTGDNSLYSSQFEEPLKALYRQGKMIWMEADIDYYGSLALGRGVPGDTKKAFPKRFKAKGGTMTYKDGAWERVNSGPADFRIDPDLPRVPQDEDFFDINDTGSYDSDNLKEFGIWRSNGKLLKAYLEAGGTFIDDFDDYKDAIFEDNNIFISGSEYNPANWPAFNLDDLPDVANGVLTFIKNSGRGVSAIKRTIKHFMYMIHNDCINF